MRFQPSRGFIAPISEDDRLQRARRNPSAGDTFDQLAVEQGLATQGELDQAYIDNAAWDAEGAEQVKRGRRKKKPKTWMWVAGGVGAVAVLGGVAYWMRS